MKSKLAGIEIIKSISYISSVTEEKADYEYFFIKILLTGSKDS